MRQGLVLQGLNPWEAREREEADWESQGLDRSRISSRVSSRVTYVSFVFLSYLSLSFRWTILTHGAHYPTQPKNNKQTNQKHRISPTKKPKNKTCRTDVLLVDDEKVSRLVVAKQLTRAGYTVTLAENGAQALEFLRKHPDRYSLILSDVMMPEVNGLELLKAVRSERALASIPMVMMSSHEQAALVFECVRRGAEDYVLKPISTKEVLYLWQHVYRRQFAWKRLSGAEDEEDDEDPNDGSVYTVDEMKAHCLRQIERYQKVLKVIEQYPEAFPTVHDS